MFPFPFRRTRGSVTLVALLVCSGYLVSTVLPVSAQSSEERIKAFNVTAKLEASRRMSVTEHIEYDFGSYEKHGIYRYIPEDYSRNGATYGLRFSTGPVTRDGSAEDNAVSHSDGNMEIKIGNAKRTITGPHTYELSYSSDRVVQFFPDHEEVYWNVNGNGWQVPIEQLSFSLQLPSGTNLAGVKADCFTGYAGSTEKSCEATVSGGSVSVNATRVLGAKEGMTVVVWLPLGTVQALSTSDRIWQFMQDNGSVFFPISALIVMYFVWRKYGKDPELGAIIPEYDPPLKASPAVIASGEGLGTVPVGKAMAATVTDLAVRGYLKMKFEKVKPFPLFPEKVVVTLQRVNEADDSLKPWEKELMNGLFASGSEFILTDKSRSLSLSSSMSKFSSSVSTAFDELGVFEANPALVITAFGVVGGLVGFGLVTVFNRSFFDMAMGVLTGITIFIFGIFMPKPTKAGTKFKHDLKGFKWFMSVTETERVKMLDAPERTPEQFQKILPYAIALGVETKWAAQFESLKMPDPTWASGNMPMSYALIATHMNSAASTFSSLNQSQAGSGGSGFSGGSSGGGFGGGGGGSW